MSYISHNFTECEVFTILLTIIIKLFSSLSLRRHFHLYNNIINYTVYNHVVY